MYKVFFQFAGIVSFAFGVVLLFDLVFFGVGKLLSICWLKVWIVCMPVRCLSSLVFHIRLFARFSHNAVIVVSAWSARIPSDVSRLMAVVSQAIPQFRSFWISLCFCHLSAAMLPSVEFICLHKDSTDFINFIERRRVPYNAILVSMDVTSLYTNIPQEEGIETVCNAYESFCEGESPIPTQYLKSAL